MRPGRAPRPLPHRAAALRCAAPRPGTRGRRARPVRGLAGARRPPPAGSTRTAPGRAVRGAPPTTSSPSSCRAPCVYVVRLRHRGHEKLVEWRTELLREGAGQLFAHTLLNASEQMADGSVADSELGSEAAHAMGHDPLRCLQALPELLLVADPIGVHPPSCLCR